MKRLSTGVLAVVMTLCGLTALAAPSIAAQGNTGNSVAQGGAPPPADFGSPPSGQIPILYNDHHVYSRPDVLKQGRVLAALVKGGTILIPLRSMFEQMGATVAWDAGSQTATVSKPGAEVKVTVGKPEVVINGETRPLDVPPIVYQGNVLVPVRVISEGMGAYVQWVPDRHIVVVRYIPATPPPSAAPPPPAPPPPPPPPPTPRPLLNEAYVAGDYIFSPSVYNEFNPGDHAHGGNGGYAVHGAATFNLGGLGLMLGADFAHWPFPHNCTTVNSVPQPNCYVTVIGHNGSTAVPTTTTLYDQESDARLGIGIAKWDVYVAGSYVWINNNYGYPTMNGVGFGGSRLPNLSHELDFFGDAYYYPQINGNASVQQPNSSGTGFRTVSLPLQYSLFKYQGGITFALPNFPIFLEAGWRGESWGAKQNAPISRTYNGPFAGLGLKFLYP